MMMLTTLLALFADTATGALHTHNSYQHMDLPVIDMAPFVYPKSFKDADREKILRHWDKGMSKFGMVTIINHGVKHSQLEKTNQYTKAFFKMENDLKMEFHQHPDNGPSGFTPPGYEHVAHGEKGTHAGAHEIETFVFRHGVNSPDILPDKPEGFSDVMKKYHYAMEKLLKKIMKLSALSLGLDENFFNSFYSWGPCKGCDLRLAYYPVLAEDEESYGAHSDFTGFTILQNEWTVGGLEALNHKNEWVHIDPVPNSLVVNAGELITRWTNDRWKSPVHRVHGDTQTYHRDRYTTVFYSGPDHDKIIEPLETCVKDGKPHYEPIAAGEHLRQRLARFNSPRLAAPEHGEL